MAAQYVRPYLKEGKNDANDAEAICEAVGRPWMRFVPIKSSDQQAIQALHRVQPLLPERFGLLVILVFIHLSRR